MERSSETIVCSKTKTAHELRDLGQGNSDNHLETITLLVTTKPAYGLPLENYDQAKMERDSVSPLVLQDQEYFAYSWFRKLILLIYLISLGVAAITILIFPVAGALKDLKDVGLGLLAAFSEWLAINLGIIWIFSAIGISSFDAEPMPPLPISFGLSKTFNASKDYIKDIVPPKLWRWFVIFAWGSIIFPLFCGSLGIGYLLVIWDMFNK